MSPSSTASPSPSVTVPSRRMAPGWLGSTSRASPSYGTTMWRKGPIVWDGVRAGTRSVLHRRRLAAAQNDVVAIPERPLLDGPIVVIAADHPVTRPLVAHRVEDRVLEEE